MKGAGLGVRWALGAAALMAGAGLVVLILTTIDHAIKAGEVIVLFAAIAFIGSGLALWARRPLIRTGPLLVWVGLAQLVSLMWTSELPVLAALGNWVSPLYLALLTWALLAFPTGRLTLGWERVVVVAAFVDLAVVYHMPLVVPGAPWALAVRKVSLAAAAVLFAVAAALLLVRWFSGSKAWRRAVAPVLWPGAITLLALSYYDVNGFLWGPDELSIWVFRVTFALLPFAFLGVLLRGRLARASVAELVVELERAQAGGDLRRVLARTLGDPSVSVAYWLPDESRYVEVEGRAVELPAAGSGRSATHVERDGRRVAAIVHDDALLDEPELLRAVAAAAGLALDNERLNAELRARVEELAASRARIVEAITAERRRIERNLHDGAQQRLTSVTLALGMAEARLRHDPEGAGARLSQARQVLAAAVAELRELSLGIHPSVLANRGLLPALEDLVYDTPIPVQLRVGVAGRLPEPVEEAAYYVVAESLTNVAKHASATLVEVELSRSAGWLSISVRDDGCGGADPERGSGLRGLADRVQALGGKHAVRTAPGGGTEIRAEIPCE